MSRPADSPDGLDRYQTELSSEVLERVRSWNSQPELSVLLERLRHTLDRRPFMDVWAEAMVAEATVVATVAAATAISPIGWSGAR